MLRSSATAVLRGIGPRLPSISKLGTRNVLPAVAASKGFSSSSHLLASYRRFGEAGGSSYPASSSSNPLGRLTQSLTGGGKGEGNGNSRQRRILLVVGGGAMLYVIFHIEKVPETGRWRFIDLSPAQERAMGDATYQDILRQTKGKILPASDPRSKEVRKVAARIVTALDKVDMASSPNAQVSSGDVRHGTGSAAGGSTVGGDKENPSIESSNTDWEVFVIRDDEQMNAFVLPGGKIFVYTGILPICKGEDGLATVLGHEVAHQLARHSAEKVSGLNLLMWGAFGVELLFGIDFGITRLASTFLLELPNSRKVEEEADYIGLKIMAKACYDPREAPKLWERMQAQEAKRDDGFSKLLLGLVSTHPVSSKRIQNMEKWLPEALQTRDSANCPSPSIVFGFQSAGRLNAW